MAEDLPKQELLIKLLALTASDSEGEALSAMRKANSLLATAGWTWERLIRGKTRIIEDPFKNIATPENRSSVVATSTPMRPAPQPRPQAQPRYEPPPSKPSTPPPRMQFKPPKGARMSKRGPDLSDL